MSRRSEHTTKVFVGSLPPNVTADDLRQLFAPYGEIAECDIANRCGFLHLEDKDLATKAIEELNNTNFMGARISVEKGRVKPRGERRMRTPGGAGGRGGSLTGGRKRDPGPYARDPGYPRGPQRNGNYGRDEYTTYDYRGEYGRPAYDDGFDRRPMYDDRRGGATAGYMTDRRPYNNGYERRPYPDDRTPYADMQRTAYDDRRMPQSTPGSYDDRRPPMDSRRPLIDEQGMGQAAIRPPLSSYERAPPSNDMYSRRDSTPKPLTGSYDRQAATSYTTNYTTPATNTYGMTGTTGTYGAPTTGYSQQTATGYGDTRTQTAGYIDTRQQTAAVAGGYTTSQGYTTTPSGGYGDNYSVRAPTNTYDTAYPPLPQQRGFAGGNDPVDTEACTWNAESSVYAW